MKELTATYLGNPFWLWILVALVEVAAVGSAALLRHRIHARLHREGESVSGGVRAIFLLLARNTSVLLLAGVSLWSAALLLSLPEKGEKIVRVVAIWSLAGQALLWIHGGGYVMGSAAQDDALCRLVAERLGVIVAAVDYRLAPEHPFPVPLDDCHDALVWLAARVYRVGMLMYGKRATIPEVWKWIRQA